MGGNGGWDFLGFKWRTCRKGGATGSKCRTDERAVKMPELSGGAQEEVQNSDDDPILEIAIAMSLQDPIMESLPCSSTVVNENTLKEK